MNAIFFCLQATESSPQFGHYFDISKSMRESLLESVKRTEFDPRLSYNGWI